MRFNGACDRATDDAPKLFGLIFRAGESVGRSRDENASAMDICSIPHNEGAQSKPTTRPGTGSHF